MPVKKTKVLEIDVSNMTKAEADSLFAHIKNEIVLSKARKAAATKEVKAKKKGVLNPLPISGVSAHDVPSEVKEETFARLVPTKVVVDEDSTNATGEPIKWLPEYQTAGAANCDLRVVIPADVSGKREVLLPYRTCVILDCGFNMQLPPGYKAEVSARSGLAAKGMVVVNAPGQVDEDYRGRIKVIVGNIGKEILKVEHGDRIAQMWPVPVHKFDWQVVDKLDESDRGEGGFGHTGIR